MSDSLFLQQASHITRGIYHRVDHVDALSHYFLSLYSVDGHVRRHLHMPESADVDFRAACFCHRRVIDSGFVCSVCLSSA